MSLSRAYRLRIAATLLGAVAITASASEPWIRTNPAHEGFMTPALYQRSTSGHGIGTLLFWGTIAVAGLFLVELVARKLGAIDHLPLRGHITRLLGVLALGASLLTILQFPPFVVDRSRIVTNAVYPVAIGGALLIVGSAGYRLRAETS